MDTIILAAPFAAAALSIAALVLSMRRRGLARLYWLLAAASIIVGTGLAAIAVFFPPEEYDAEGHLIGEMPKAFGAGLDLAVLGIVMALAGLAVLAILGLRRRLRP